MVALPAQCANHPDDHLTQDDLEEEMGGGLAPFSVSEIMEHCIEPTVSDGLKHMGKIIVWCLLFRIVVQL